MTQSSPQADVRSELLADVRRRPPTLCRVCHITRGEGAWAGDSPADEAAAAFSSTIAGLGGGAYPCPARAVDESSCRSRRAVGPKYFRTQARVFDDVGHLFFWERPERAAELVASHRSLTERTPGTIRS